MSMSRLGLLLLVPLVPLFALGGEEYDALGESVSQEQLDAAIFTVMPDGQGLPGGAGTAADGKAVYEQHCMACHGENGEGTLNDRLAGGRGTIDGPQPVKTVGSYWPYATTLFDYIRRAMPYNTPGSLDDDELYAVTAYVLHLNDIVGETERLDAASLPDVHMPNRDNFDRAWP